MIPKRKVWHERKAHLHDSENPCLQNPRWGNTGVAPRSPALASAAAGADQAFHEGICVEDNIVIMITSIASVIIIISIVIIIMSGGTTCLTLLV